MALDTEQQKRFNRLLQGVILPGLAITESIVSRGKSPGTGSLGVLKNIQQREDKAKASVIQKEDKDRKIAKEALETKLRTLQIGGLERKQKVGQTAAESSARSSALLKKNLELAGEDKEKIAQVLFQHQLDTDPAKAQTFLQTQKSEKKKQLLEREKLELTKTKADIAAQKLDQQAKKDDANTQTQLEKTERLISQQEFQNESAITKEYTTNSKSYNNLKKSFKAIEESRDNPSPAGDISMVFSFMKLLDERSTVREGEFATVKNAAGVPEVMRNTYNKLLKGEFLDPKQRTDLLQKTGVYYENAIKNQFRRRKNIMDRASAFGLNAERIVNGIDIYIPPTLTQNTIKEIQTIIPDFSIPGQTTQEFESKFQTKETPSEKADREFIRNIIGN